jgi:superkiller protein 3
MKALALATAVSVVLACAVGAQDSGKTNGARRGMEAAVTPSVDVAAIQKKIENFSEGVKNEPKNDKWYGARGQSYWRIGKYDLALKDMNQAIALNSTKSAYFAVRGDVFSKLNRNREAYDDYGKAIAIGPPTHYLFLQRGYTAVCFKDYKAAEESAKSALALSPNDADTLALIGGIDGKLGKLQESLKYLDKAISIHSTDPSLYTLRAETHRGLGHIELAKKDLEAAKRVSESSR